jgi:hypothetical protein
VRAAQVPRASPMAAHTRKSQPKTGRHPTQPHTYPANPSSEDTALATFNWKGQQPPERAPEVHRHNQIEAV